MSLRDDIYRRRKTAYFVIMSPPSLSRVSIISRTGKKGLVVTVDVTAHERKSLMIRRQSTDPGNHGPGPVEPARYPSRSQENQRRLGIKSERSKQSPVDGWSTILGVTVCMRDRWARLSHLTARKGRFGPAGLVHAGRRP